jgi:hypothetical protein
MRRFRALAYLMLAVLATALVPAPLDASRPMLGTVRGPRTARLSLNGGKSWLALGGRSLPIMSGTEIRSLAGTAQLTLTDGSRITVMPFSALTFRDTSRGTELSMAYGRLTFSLAERTALEILTPTARLEPMLGPTAEGEVFVTGAGLTGLKMRAGTLHVRDLTEASRVRVAGIEPVFVPARPAMPGLYFSGDTPATPPTNARAVFLPDGLSIGYVRGDGALVIAPGYTRNLTRPFSPKLVRVAMNAIPDKDRASDATPLFDVNGGYVGYLAGPVFYAQATPPPGAEVGAPSEAASVETLAAGLSGGTITGLGAVGGVIGVGTMSATGVVGSEQAAQQECQPPMPEATPTQPSAC